ncbi:5635_t:CDS:1 [Ambispora leptoticha]|uniref:5635_t:CDS:1 n=1 Tax=Ambispora leptoticha TaxID=144679 RepID=A0A9N8WM14_9GLOM|nr:5635_t:CDS:1 [Ambispora leptoticha]
MSGRSGRRGFDPVGNVIFFGLTQTKISRLLVSDLPNLSGHFPLTTTMVLRSFLLLTQSKNTDYAEKAIKGFLGTSFFCLGKEYLSTQIKHHLYFSIQYLIRENLLTYDGQLLNLAGAVYHLYYTEPSNFAFAVLYKHGVFHEICSNVYENSQYVKDTLMLVLSNLFNVIRLRSDGSLSEAQKKYPSKVVLDPIPKSIQRTLNEHNDRVLRIYSAYIISYAKTLYDPDNKLPLSGSQFPPKSSNLDHLTDQLMQTCVSFTARSPFMAVVSGQGDRFRNVYDLTSHLRSNIFLDANSIPFVETDRYLKNAYLLDFFSHGQENALIKANWIRPGELWQVLKDFSLTLNAICTSLETMDGSDENVLYGFTIVRDEFNEKFKKIWA